ncbi:hypothetical protein [Streptomyces sp. WM6368]|uniref:hypothetical protein n=1 Tax=Streptomyces sp. WM6368 TaxID=1415554 RepID=UPI000AC7B184|nr:hypothetical protein [Streptomyces sp. WM6368]
MLTLPDYLIAPGTARQTPPRASRLAHTSVRIVNSIGPAHPLDLAERIGRDEPTTALFDPEAVSALRPVAAEIDSLNSPRNR